MADRWAVYCPHARWESEPVDRRDDALEMLDWPEPLHPFAGSCSRDHIVVEYPGE